MNVKDRWQFGYGYRGNFELNDDIQKYGWNEGFIHSIVNDNLTKEEAEEMEKQLIKELNTTDSQYGYNKTFGGKENIPTEEAIQNMSDGLKERKLSKRHKQRLSINHNRSKKVKCGNTIFRSIKKCSEYYGVNYGSMKDWLNGKYNMPQKFKELNLRYYNE